MSKFPLMEQCLLCDKLVYKEHYPYCEICVVAVSKGMYMGIMLSLHAQVVVTCILLVLFHLLSR